MKYEINAEDLQKVINYLGKQPWCEVADLMNRLGNVVAPKPAVKPKPVNKLASKEPELKSA